MVAQFPRSLPEVALMQAFGTLVGQGKVTHCSIVRESGAHSEWHAVVEFADEAAARKAQAACNAGELILVDTDGSHLSVTASRLKRAAPDPAKTEKHDVPEWAATPLRLIL